MKAKSTASMIDENALENLLRKSSAALWDIHPASEHLVAFQEGSLAKDDADAIKRHVGGCQECKEKVSLLEKADRSTGFLESVKEALVRLVEYTVPARAVATAAAASRAPRDAPDEEIRLDEPGTGDFEAYLQRFGSRLAIAVFAKAGRNVEVVGVRDAFTGEPVGTPAGQPRSHEWLFDLGSAKTMAGRKVALVLVEGSRPVRIEVNIAKARRRRRSS